MTTLPRPEYPRPQFVRSRWTNLNGEWAFAFDDHDVGTAASWHATPADAVLDPRGPFDQRIVVPFAFQAKLSGIGDTARHDVVWYARTFDDVREGRDERLQLHFGAVDYRAAVWVNGQRVIEHEGGHTPFSADVTNVIGARDNTLVVRAEDPLDDLAIPRGKQYWQEESEGIFYTATTGIWQTVWLEPMPARRIVDVSLVPDVDRGCVHIRADLTGAEPDETLEVTISSDGVPVASDRIRVIDQRIERTLSVVPPATYAGANAADAQGIRLWSPERPHLHEVRLALGPASAEPTDEVHSYLGMRSITVSGDQVLLNGRPYTQRLVLDQGYFPGGNLTAATDDDLRADIELAKQLGFNGARKHQKVEDPRWLYWADRLGFLVWGEMPSAYAHAAAARRRVVTEWQEVVARDRNHPSIVVWVPMNESWGTPRLSADDAERSHLRALYHLTKAMDPSRLVVSNDGWEHATTDLCTIHDYTDASAMADRYRHLGPDMAIAPAGRSLYVPGHHYQGEPVLVTEFGGVAVAGGDDVWGYHRAAHADDLLDRYRALVTALTQSPHVRGFCYTQLTDVEQEANGLLTFDREPKADPEAIRRATTLHDPGGS